METERDLSLLDEAPTNDEVNNEQDLEHETLVVSKEIDNETVNDTDSGINVDSTNFDIESKIPSVIEEKICGDTHPDISSQIVTSPDHRLENCPSISYSLEEENKIVSDTKESDIVNSEYEHVMPKDTEYILNENDQSKPVLFSSKSSLKNSSSADSLSCSDVPLPKLQLEEQPCDNEKRANKIKFLGPTPYDTSDTDSLSEFNSDVDYTDTYLTSAVDQGGSGQAGKQKQRISRNKRSVEYFELEYLEKNNKKLLAELYEVKSKLSFQESEFQKCQDQMKSELEAKIDKLSKLCESLKKEKETMVIRYANSEKDVIMLKKAVCDFEKKLKDSFKARDNLSSRVKTLQGEKAKLAASIDQKVMEHSTVQRDNERLKEELSSKDIKIKWIQSKLKTEMDCHVETQGKLDHTMHRLQEMREEAEQVRKDCQEMVRRYQEAEEIKSVKLDHELKEKLSELEVQKQERSDQEEVYQLLRQELEALKKKQRITIEENNNLTLKIHGLEKDRLEYEQTLSKLKDTQNSLKQEVVDLNGHLDEMENLKLHLEREKEKVNASAREVERLRQTNAELQSDMDACHMKEGELLEFTESLTTKTVHLQSEHSLLESKAQTLEEQVTHLNKQCIDMEQKITDLTTSLEEEQKLRQGETQLLARKLAEKTKAVEQLNVKLEESYNENNVMKRRHITSIKELSRELQQSRKKLEAHEANCMKSDSAGLNSRASSSASLDNINNSSHNSTSNTPVSTSQVQPPVVFSSGKSTSSNQPSQVLNQEVNKQMLIERIVKLQKMLAKKNDKIEFLEDHICQLVKEMKKKSKIIQNYILKTETGALIPNSSDMNKMDVSKRGGIMASVYRSQLSDSNLTLELSLEINNKLQAVLEDTLLKNITLKENINTLGEEIARLTAEKREKTQPRPKCSN